MEAFLPSTALFMPPPLLYVTISLPHVMFLPRLFSCCASSWPLLRTRQQAHRICTVFTGTHSQPVARDSQISESRVRSRETKNWSGYSTAKAYQTPSPVGGDLELEIISVPIFHTQAILGPCHGYQGRRLQW